MHDLNQEEYLEHYGILGMKWGVRRTPEELGHKTAKPKDKMGAWKYNKTSKINKMYAKAIAEAEKAEAAYPKDKSIKQYKKQLQSLQKSDLKKIEDMSYMDVQRARKAESQARKDTALKVATSAGKTLTWGLNTAWAGSRVYGLLKVVNIMSQSAKPFTDYLASEEGKALIKKGGAVADKIVKSGDQFSDALFGVSNAISTNPAVNTAHYIDSQLDKILKG